MLRTPDLSQPQNTRVDYLAMPFDDKPTTPYQWPHYPFLETGDVHGNGNLIVFTDGSVGDLKTVVKSQSGK